MTNDMQLIENDQFKIVRSQNYNFIFRKSDGYFERWGETREDDPQFSPFGMEILDLEISSGKCMGGCRFCYKSNGPTATTKHMSLETFKKIFEKMPKTLTQIAFGICDIRSNPDFFPMMKYAKKHGVVPNFTCHGLDVDSDVANETAKTCGAVAVSIVNKDKSYDAIKMFTDAGMRQVNIHLVYHSDNMPFVYEVLKDTKNDLRLAKLNAIVLLGLKNKGRGEHGFNSLSADKFAEIVEFAMSNEISIGFDSCSAPKYEKWVEESNKSPELKKTMLQVAEPCESNLFSFYINCEGIAFPCSFMEEVGEWKQGIPVLDCDDFIGEVWNNPKFIEWRKKLLGNFRRCPVYNV